MTFPSRILFLITLWACFVWIEVECNPTVANPNAGNEKQGSKKPQTGHEKVAGFDRGARLGDTYDETTDDIRPKSIFKAGVPNEAIQYTNISYSSIQLIGDEPLKEKMRKLDIPPSQFISFLLGLSDQHEYLEEFKRSPGTAKASLVYKFGTVVESYDPYSNASVAEIDRRVLEISKHTHVIVGLEYGAEFILTLEKRCDSQARANQVQKQLEADIQSIIEYVSGDGIDPSTNISKSHKFSRISVSGDMDFVIHPFSVPNIIHNIKKYPTQLKDKKGSPKGFILEPLQNIRASLDIQSNSTGFAKKMDQEFIDKLLNIFQELEDSTRLIHDFCQGMIDWSEVIPSNSSERRNISRLCHTFKYLFADYEYNLKKDLKNRIVEFRRGKVELETIKEVISSYENGNWTAEAINHTISNNFGQTMKKIYLMNLLSANGANFINGIDNELHTIAMSGDEKELRFLLADLSMDISSPYIQDIVKLLESSKGSATVKYYVRDVAVPRPKVEVYSRGGKIKTILVGKE